MIFKKYKKIISIMIVLIYNINLFASIVSDYDTSTFVTKSEFDGVKKHFADLVSNYNESIDDKIDGAIAAYLSGIRLISKSNFDGFVEVSGDKPQIYGRKKDYEKINKQLWNDLTCNMTIFGTAGGTAASYKPFYSNTNGGVTDGQYSYWILKVQSAKSPYKYMRGYQFNTDGVVTKIYDDDQVVLTISDTGCYDTWGSDMGVLAYVNKSSFTSQELECGKLYTNSLTIPNNRWSQSNAANNSTTVLNNYADFLYDIETNTKATGYASMENAGTLCLINTFYAEHVQKNEANECINTYNTVDATIYAYPESAKKIETFCDPITTYDISNRGRRWQLAMYTNDDSFLYGQLSGYAWYNYNARGNTIKHRYGLYVPKIKLKNDTSIAALKPTVTAPDDTGNKFNNLNQFRNGYMSYTDKSGNKCYPYFYGGIPLFNMENLTEKVSFKLKIDATTAGVNKIRVWIKEGEFPNANYDATSTAWTAVDQMTGNTHNNDLVKGLVINGVEKNERYVDIDAGSIVTIEIDEPNRKMPYFLRFAEVNTSGTCLNEGGKVTLLTDFIAYTS